jgi:hypothetical protein
MKSLAAGTASSCLIWFLVFGLVSFCLCPVTMFLGGISSTLQADFVARVLQPYLCPDNSTAEVVTFQTTSQDEFGNATPATGYEMRCVDADGDIVRAASPDYAFYWIGLLALAGLIVSGVLALVLAAPIGAFITHRMRRSQGASTS